MNHEYIADLLGAYALNAVDGDEQRVIERHLTRCESCQSEVDGFRQVTTLLAESTDEAPPLWGEIADKIAPRQRHKWFSPSLMSIAASLVIVAMAGALVVQQRTLTQRNATIAEQEAVIAAAQPSLEQRMTVALSAADTVTYDLAGDNGTVTLVVEADGTAYVTQNSLDALASDRTYQLWAVVDGRVVSAGLLGSTPAVTELRIEGPVQLLALTDEVAGGVVVSEQAPAAVWSPDA